MQNERETTSPASLTSAHCPLPTALIETLGCKVNRYDSEQLALGFSRYGFITCTDYRVIGSPPDVVVVNTCSVTRESERKGRQLIRRLARLYPCAKIIVTGCTAQLYSEALRSIPGVAAVCLIADQPDLPRRVAHDAGLTERTCQASVLHSDRTRAFVKVQEGCDLFCSYCSIPYSRGQPRSRPIPEVREEIARLIERGFREVVLCGTRLGCYGRDMGTDLTELLKDLCTIRGLDRLRLSSLEPEDVHPALVDLFSANDILCPHLHLPVQSGSDRVLERMGRGYRRADYLRKAEHARKGIADLCISTDIMVGFPGETDSDFAETLSLVEQSGFSKVHSFPFSPRPGTPAAELPDQIPADIRTQRRIALDRLALAKAEDVRSAFLGRRLPVLVESCENGCGVGLTPNYLRVRFPSPPGLTPNTLADITLQEVSGLLLLGRCCSPFMDEGRGEAEQNRKPRAK
jgi:threonylcarbamoyladenosine tRNA methylthiotransferase MtaB